MPPPVALERDPIRLAVFALQTGTGRPLPRLPVYAEVVWSDVEITQPPDGRFESGVVRGLTLVDRACSNEPACLTRVTRAISIAIVRVLAPATRDAIAGDQSLDEIAFFKDALETALRDAGVGTIGELREEDLVAVIEGALRKAAERADLAVIEPPEPSPPRLVSHPLGVLATDHVGFLSFDLERLPRPVLDAVRQATHDLLDPPATRKSEPAASIFVHPLGLATMRFDALAQRRFAHDAIVLRLELDVAPIPPGVPSLGQLSLQNPGLTDWRLSPSSFATNPESLVGADGCESILPANVALQEYYLYQVVRLTDVEPPVAARTPDQVQLGVVHEYRVAWHPLGHSLGQILYSLPLAPGESVNLAVIDWTRRDEAQRKERTTVDEQLIHNEHRDRIISETVDAAIREYQRGSSFMGGIAGAGGIAFGGSGSAGIAGSLGGSTSNSSGTRNVSATTVQKVSDNITQVSSASRELQSTVVVQSTQSEKETIETRTVANYNHSHALTILYYEVLRHFRVSTELVRRRPAVLVKIKSDWFAGADAEKNAREHRKALEPALLDSRVAGGFDALDRFEHRRQVTVVLGPPPTPPPPPVAPLAPGDREFVFFKFEMKTGGMFTEDMDEHDQRVEVVADLVGMSPAVQLVNPVGNNVLNQRGAFRERFAVNTFFAVVPAPHPPVRWSSISALFFFINVLGDDNHKVSFEHIKVTGVDVFGVPELLIDQDFSSGHLIITNDEGNAHIALPTRLPPPPPPPPAPPGRPAEEIEDEVNRTRLLAHLKDHAVHYSRAIYFGREGLQRAAELDAIKLTDGSNVLEKVENRPIEVIGDYVAFPGTDKTWEDAIIASLDEDQADEVNVDVNVNVDERLVTLPTRGVFAEAKLGHCNASELIDNTRFWDWQQSPIPQMAPEIAPITAVTPQPQQQNLAATPFPASIVNIVNPPNAPDPTGMAGALSLLATPNIFRDMSGRAEVADILKNLADNATKMAAAANAARGQSGTGGSTGTGGGGVGGPRAMPNQPSATNRDLHDLANVLDRAQSQGLITPEAAREAYADAVAGLTARPAGEGEALSSADLPAGEFIPFVDSKRLHPKVAAVLSGFMSAPLNSWRHMIARFALTELSADRLIGIVLASQAADIRPKFLSVATDPQPGSVSAAAFFDGNIAIGGAVAVTIGARAKNGGRSAFILLSPAGLQGTATITRTSNGTSVSVSLEETLVHELTHVRNQPNQQILLTFPDSSATIYVDPALAAAETAANSAAPKAATVQVLRRFTEEMTARHVHWRVRTELGATAILNFNIQPAQLAIATHEYFRELSGVFSPAANAYVQEINRRGVVAQLNQVAMWMNVCSFYAFSDKTDQDGHSRQLFRLAAAWATREAATATPLADTVEAQGLAPLLRDFV